MSGINTLTQSLNRRVEDRVTIQGQDEQERRRRIKIAIVVAVVLGMVGVALVFCESVGRVHDINNVGMNEQERREREKTWAKVKLAGSTVTLASGIAGGTLAIMQHKFQK